VENTSMAVAKQARTADLMQQFPSLKVSFG
jgi:hypothetical protein